MVAALESLGESKMPVNDTDAFILHMHRADKPNYQKLRTGPPLLNDRDRLEKDLAQATALVKRLEGEIGDARGSAAIGAHFTSLREAATAALSEMPEDSKTLIMSGIVRLSRAKLCCCPDPRAHRSSASWMRRSTISATSSTLVTTALASAIFRRSSSSAAPNICDGRPVAWFETARSTPKAAVRGGLAHCG
jgi:hypothetical protein